MIVNEMNFAAVQQLLTGTNGAVYRDMLRRGLKVETRAKAELQSNPSRVDTGRLRGSIRARMIQLDGVPVCRVGTNVEYALFVHDGTGLYGPNHRYIVPVNKSVLRWKTKGSGGKNGYTFAKRSSGMRPNPFLKNALPAMIG
jgi:bacteriophage HK97-gp10 putative tail-component